jgi:exodeoxyribonuclease V alpha subunit
VINAHRVNRGELPQLRVPRGTQTDFYFIEAEEPEKAVSLIRELVKRRLPRAFHLDPLDDIQVMTPMHRGTAGVTNLNAELQSLLNANGKGLVRGGRLLQVNDKVMQTKNNYMKETFNGDIGKIVGIDPAEQKLRVAYDGRLVNYEWSELDELVLAYAISIHKSQGSEYPAVVIPRVSLY